MTHTPTTPNVNADRTVEYSRLITQQGALARSRRIFPAADYSEFVDEERERCRRLEDLATLINATLPDDSEVRRDPATDVERWIELNPAALTNQIIEARLADGKAKQTIATVAGVYVGIGHSQGGDGYHYQVMVSDFSIDHYGQIQIRIPESVAEHFRNQGRQRLRHTLRSALGL